ncbi:hypothetical protein BZA70DRAFT_131887 [Myxozyma melibiosi]|uniref:Uncharacterized protein n=1 Tax=Myxozyma melibiosi TaxID=54550 RepID=A0ABR1F904_9ASCO
MFNRHVLRSYLARFRLQVSSSLCRWPTCLASSCLRSPLNLLYRGQMRPVTSAQYLSPSSDAYRPAPRADTPTYKPHDIKALDLNPSSTTCAAFCTAVFLTHRPITDCCLPLHFGSPAGSENDLFQQKAIKHIRHMPLVTLSSSNSLVSRSPTHC